MSWTDERITLLKKLWVEGKTAAEIAKELGGVTRNAVIGKAHRLKLSNRVSPIQQNKKPVVKQAPVVSTEKKIQRIIEQDTGREGISLFDLAPRGCRWPLGDPREEKFGFCGSESVPGLPYCPDHSKVAYQAAGRSRTLQAESFEEKAVVVDGEEEIVKNVQGKK